MPGRGAEPARTVTNVALDRSLAVLVVAMGATGLLSLRAGSTDLGWLFVLHGIIGGALAVAVATKIRRSLPPALRRSSIRRLAIGLLVSGLVVGSIVAGFAWVAGGRIVSVGSWTLLTLHAWLGIVLVPIVVLHLSPRRWRLLRPGPHAIPRTAGRISRRSLLAGAALMAAGGAVAVTANLLDRLNGGDRRFTGSRLLPSGGVPPTTTFFGEPTPNVDPAAWRVSVDGLVANRGGWSLVELESLGTTDMTAILDCTSGWAIETAWHGVPVGALLAAAGVVPSARHVTIRSVTGWSASLPIDDARACLLATGVAGQRLPAGNGGPLRLVAPDRRGLEWVKWVDRIEVA